MNLLKTIVRSLGISAVIAFVIFSFSFATNTFNVWVFIGTILFCYFFIYYIDYIRPLRLMMKGNFKKVYSIWESGLSRAANPDLRNTLLYNMGICLNRMGDFDRSNEVLGQIQEDRLDKNLKAEYFVARASNIMGSNGNLDLALEYIKKSQAIHWLASNHMAQIHFALLKNDIAQAAQGIDEYKMKHAKKIRWSIKSIILIDGLYMKLCENLLFGLFFLKQGDIARAKEFLSAAATYPYNVYTANKAKELLASLN